MWRAADGVGGWGCVGNQLDVQKREKMRFGVRIAIQPPPPPVHGRADCNTFCVSVFARTSLTDDPYNRLFGLTFNSSSKHYRDV